MSTRRLPPREQLAVLIGLALLALVLAVVLSVQALGLVRERTEAGRRVMATQLDALSRTVALRTEYLFLTPIATALGRAAPGAPAPGAFATQLMQQMASCTCVTPTALIVRVDGSTHPVVTSNQPHARDAALARWLADTLARQARLPHLSSANLIGRPEWAGGAQAADGRIVFGLLVASPAAEPRLFGYMARFAASDTIDFMLAAELDPHTYLSRALADSTALPGTKAMPVTFRTMPVTIDVADASGTTLIVDARPRWVDGSRTVSLPPDVGRLALHIAPATPLRNAVEPPATSFDTRKRLLAVVALFLLTVSLGVIAMVQLRREYALARRRTRFVSGVSHELRTPLAQIRLFAELLRDEDPTMAARRTEYARIIDEEAQRLTLFVDNVLAFTTLDENTAAMHRHLVSLSDVVADTVERFAPLAASRAAMIEASVAPGVMVTANEEALRRIFLNVLDNAVKYGPAGQTIRVALTLDRGSAYVTVDDAGPGVATADRHRMFEPFVRLHSTGSAATGGSGIGLAIVRSLVIALNGTVCMADAPGEGARVRLAFLGATMRTEATQAVPPPTPQQFEFA